MTADATLRVGRSRTGLGLFATANIQRGTAIVEYCGPRIPTADARDLEQRGSNRYIFEINGRWSIDGSARSNVARYVNHACRPNAEAHLVRGKIVFHALRRIEPGDEITIDYGQDYIDLFFKHGCRCTACYA